MTNKGDFLICRTEKYSSSMASSMGYSKCSYNKSKCVSLSLSSLFSPSLPHPQPHCLSLSDPRSQLFLFIVFSLWKEASCGLYPPNFKPRRKEKNFSLLSSSNKCPKIDETALVIFLFLEQSLGPEELLF